MEAVNSRGAACLSFLLCGCKCNYFTRKNKGKPRIFVKIIRH
nr:MAG TPA: Lysis protein [Caudoviricetes sp.]